MTITLRQESATGATTKSATLSYKELDDNFIHLLNNKIRPLQVNADTGVVTVGEAQSNGVFTITGDADKIQTTVTEDSGGNANLSITLASPFATDLDGAITFEGKNTSGGTIEPGQVVYISGISGNTPEIQLARANADATMPAFGIATETIANTITGTIATFGSKKGLDVADFGETGITFALGDTLYISSAEAGKITNVAPTGESNRIQNIGKIERATPTTNMTIKVGGAGRTNATSALNNGNIFIGNASNVAVTTSLQTQVESYSINNVVEDTTPQLGGTLDAQSNNFTNVGTINSHTIPGGTGTFALTSDISDSDTTYSISSETTTGGANLRLTDSSAGTDDVKIAQGTGITVTRTDANTITIASTVTSGIANVVEDTTPQLGGSLDVNGNAIVSTSNADININPDGSGKVQINNTYTLPNADGTNGQVLTTDGAGTLSFTTVSSGGISNVVEDTTPQLGGNLDVNGNSIVSTSAGDINITPDGAGKVVIDGLNYPTADGTNGQVMTTDGAGNITFTTVSGGGSSTLDGLTDVTITSVSDEQYLRYDSGTSQWINETVTGVTNLNDLSDVSASGPTNNQIIKYNTGSSQWELGTALSNVSEDSTPQLGGTLDCQDNIVQSPQLKDYTETVYTSGTATGTITPDVANGNVQMITLSGDITLNALSNVSNGQSMTLIVRQPSSGGPYTLSSTMKFAGGTKTLTTTANAYDIISIFYQDSTHGYFASLSTNFS